MTTCTSMVESVRIERKCWMGVLNGSTYGSRVTSLVHFKVSWTMGGGYQREDTKVFDGMDLLELPRGCVPMVSHIYTLPFDGHPGACTPAVVYLVRTYDAENDLEDVEARIQIRPEGDRHNPDAIFEIQPLDLQGPNIFPLPIHDEVD